MNTVVDDKETPRTITIRIMIAIMLWNISLVCP